MPRYMPQRARPLAFGMAAAQIPAMSLMELKESAAKLPDIEKGKLAAWLLDSLPPHETGDGTADSLQEAARRRDELDSGRVTAMSADEFWAAVERDRSSWK